MRLVQIQRAGVRRADPPDEHCTRKRGSGEQPDALEGGGHIQTVAPDAGCQPDRLRRYQNPAWL